MKQIIIAEAGVNHNGSLKKLLRWLISQQMPLTIKFQTFIPSGVPKKFWLGSISKKFKS